MSSNKDTLPIYWRATADSDAVLLGHFPRDIARAQSHFIDSQHQRRRPALTGVTGSTREAVKDAFHWMLNASNGTGMRSYTAVHAAAPIVKAHHDRAAATLLGIDTYLKQIEAYIKRRLTKMLSYNEVVGLHELDKYGSYRPLDGPAIPAGELDVLLRIPALPQVKINAIVKYVADKVWAYMELNYCKEKGEGVVDQTRYRQLKSIKTQYQIIRDNHKKKVGDPVDELIDEKKK